MQLVPDPRTSGLSEPLGRRHTLIRVEWKPRLIDPSELRATGDVTTVAFGEGPACTDERFAQLEVAVEVDRTFAVDDGSTIVGTATSYSLEMGLPRGSVPMAGVSWVGVLPTHRRRGILTALMDALLEQARDREEPVAGLGASEGGIYRRFGFGVATQCQTVVVDTAQAEEMSAPSAPGTIRFLSEDEATTVLPAVWEHHWRRTPGEVSRTDGFWSALAMDPEIDRDGATSRFLVVHERPDGEPDGFAIYRTVVGGASGGEYNELRIETVAGTDYAVEATLVRYLMNVDLVRRLRWRVASVDLPLLWQFADPGAAQVANQDDHLWLRLLDVEACLAGRTYAADGGAVIEVVDRVRPELGGRFMLDASPEGASCTRTTAEADVSVSMPDLSSLFLGGVSWRTLLLAGLVEERSLEAVHRLDTLFFPDRAPYCCTDF